jgi:hypothetical protein
MSSKNFYPISFLKVSKRDPVMFLAIKMPRRTVISKTILGQVQ